MNITQKVIINKPAAQIWKLIAHDFDKAYLWMKPIPHSYQIANESGHTGAPIEGRICHLSDNPEGAKAKEVIVDYNEEAMSLTFEITSINVPAIVPLKKNKVQMKVKALDVGTTEVTWVASPQLKTFAYPFYPLLRLILPFAFGKLLRGLKDYSESSAFGAEKIQPVS